ncbi:MAG: acyl-CoA thioesterase [Rhodobacterales bacterium]
MSPRPTPKSRDDFAVFCAISTRWKDNDAYRHVNNVTYLSFFDTAVNEHLIKGGVLDIESSDTIGLVARSNCDYFAAVSFPDKIDVGLSVRRLGTSSVTYELAVFRENETQAAAQGQLVHVYVDRRTNRPVDLPAALRAHLSGLLT